MKATLITICVISFFIILGLAGTAERNEQSIYNMSNETYHQIKKELGEGCTDKQIVAEYLDNISRFSE